MGYYEDDRIRSKNKVSNDAYSFYLSCLDKLWTSGDIQHYAEQQLTKDPKNKTMQELVLICRRSEEDLAIPTHNLDQNQIVIVISETNIC